MWWGVGWSDPPHRNISESDHCGLLANIHHLKPHKISLQAHKNRQDKIIKVTKEAAPLIAEIAINTATEGLISTFKSLFVFGKTSQDEYQTQHQETGSIVTKYEFLEVPPY